MWVPKGRFSARKPWAPTAWTVASTSSLPPCGPAWAENDLIDLDLAYAPPYGQAKDPVNQTGMVAHNVLTGELALTGPNELAEDMPVLDVRTVGEYAAGHMPNSLNIPRTQLRERLDAVQAWAVLVTGEG